MASLFAAAELTAPSAPAVIPGASRRRAVVAPIARRTLEALSRLAAARLASVLMAILALFVGAADRRLGRRLACGPVSILASFAAALVARISGAGVAACDAAPSEDASAAWLRCGFRPPRASGRRA
ncbi:hypothetical protein RZS28_07270 [Methylocapsa polymorpha]|uniref:Uncharacterized protein n=1 Tax=Methylocapsa polymorpha TaxID=3080828 RepID=A0ABZ0HUX4_9HYPH|nr:hypothetical protein RZS28_07270 [Methylocapsa sp. RX1]